VSLNTFVTIAGDGGRCAPVEPRPMPVYATPVPGPSAEPRAGTGVRILVVDTGFDDTAASRSPWLTGVTGERDEGIDPVNGTIGRYAGHGTFIAGVLRSVAPGAEVHVLAPFTGVGEVTEASLVQALEACLAEQCPDIISLSAGTAAHDAQGPLALHVFGENLLARHKGVAVVAAAGNDNHRDLFYPAALPWAVSVGALGPNALGKASFSNFGGWVDVYAPGVDLVNAFPTGTYTYAEPDENGVIPPPAKFPGMARWSGTSFSTPIVAGLIAARMSETGQNARAAAAALLTEAQANAQYGLGAVLLPS